MKSNYNNSGQPLSSSGWLEAHHNAKINERTLFANRLSTFKPKLIVDIGCGPGLWLSVFNITIDDDCEFIGVDLDSSIISEAKKKASFWNRKCTFINCDLETDIELIPSADIYFIANMFCYLKSPSMFLEQLKKKRNPRGKIIIRQFDGSLLRFGPMPQQIRTLIDSSLHSSVGQSEQFHYYDIDRTFKIIHDSSFGKKEITFELFHRSSPFSLEFIEYHNNTINWIMDHISEKAANELKKWQYKYLNKTNKASYFVGIDLVSILS